jgi:hypothetical protein
MWHSLHGFFANILLGRLNAFTVNVQIHGCRQDCARTAQIHCIQTCPGVPWFSLWIVNTVCRIRHTIQQDVPNRIGYCNCYPAWFIKNHAFFVQYRLAFSQSIGSVQIFMLYRFRYSSFYCPIYCISEKLFTLLDKIARRKSEKSSIRFCYAEKAEEGLKMYTLFFMLHS